jgi:hypothetical protein
MTDDGELSWLPLLEAAMRLGKSTDAVRSMIRRDRLLTRKGNDGRLLVGVPPVKGQAANGLTAVGDQANDGQATAAQLRWAVEELREELMETREQLAGTKAALDAAVAVRKAEVGALRELADRLTAELAETRRPWWRRWFS